MYVTPKRSCLETSAATISINVDLFAEADRVEVMSIPSLSNSFNVWQRSGNIEMPRSRPMENNFFCFVNIDSKPVSERPGTRYCLKEDICYLFLVSDAQY